MKRTAFGGRFGRAAGCVAAVALAGGLAACGGNDATVSSTPSASASATTAEHAPATGTGAPTSPAGPPAAEPTAVPKTAPPETPQALPSDYPGPTETELTDRDNRFLDALAGRHIAFADDPSAAVSAGDYVCAADDASVPDDQVHATVLASIALDAQNRGVDVDAEADTNAFIDTARKTFCR